MKRIFAEVFWWGLVGGIVASVARRWLPLPSILHGAHANALAMILQYGTAAAVGAYAARRLGDTRSVERRERLSAAPPNER